MGFGANYNALFPLYIVLFSLSLFAFILAFASLDVELGSPVASCRRCRAAGWLRFLFISAAVLFIVWFILSLLPAILSGQPPEVLDHYTTFPTHMLDLGIIMPGLILAGILLLRRDRLGYALGGLLFVMAWVLGLNISAGIARPGAGRLPLHARDDDRVRHPVRGADAGRAVGQRDLLPPSDPARGNRFYLE